MGFNSGFKGLIVPPPVSTERVVCGEGEAAGRNGVSTSVRLVFAKCCTACAQCMTKYWEDGGTTAQAAGTAANRLLSGL